MPPSPTVLFRCDGTAQTGLGHASRSLALAEALQDAGCACAFFGHFESPSEERFRAAGFDCVQMRAPSWGDEDAREVCEMAERVGAAGVVVDTYSADAKYLSGVERDGAPVLLIDDFAALSRYPCSAVLNFTVRAEALPYPREGARLLLGPSWFLARRALRLLRAKAPSPAVEVRNVLVAAGGSDVHDIVLPVVGALRAYAPRLTVHVVVGAGYTHRQELSEALGAFGAGTSLRTRLPDLAGELAWADLCVSSAGLIRYEAAYLGIPSGVLPQNDGQAADSARFAALGMTVDLGRAAAVDHERLVAGLDRLIGDRALRASLREHALSTFPLDPTRDAATVTMTEVFRAPSPRDRLMPAPR